MSRIVITDCDHPSIELEQGIFRGAGHDVVLAQYAPITGAVMAALPDFRVVGRHGVSLDNIELPAAAAHGIRVVNVPDYCIDEVADHAIAPMLGLTRCIMGLDRAIHAGTCDFRGGGELRRASGMRLGVIGLGRIGAATARRALALRYEVVPTDPREPHVVGIPLVSLDELLETSDIVSVHAWLDPSTRHLLDAAALARMRPGAFLVNTSRGGLIDQGALVAALRSGHLGGAALDVLEREPMGLDDPLLSLPNVILTPHTAFYSRESLVEMKTRVAKGIVAAIAAAR